MLMSTGGSFALKGIKPCLDKRLRYTTLPLSSIPTACNTCLAISIPRTCISCFIGLASCGSMGSRILHSLWLIAVDPHRGGSISLRPGCECLPCSINCWILVGTEEQNVAVNQYCDKQSLATQPSAVSHSCV